MDSSLGSRCRFRKKINDYSLFCLFIYFKLKLVDLQCCIGFRYVAQWFNYTYIYFFQILFLYRLFQNTEYNIKNKHTYQRKGGRDKVGGWD